LEHVVTTPDERELDALAAEALDEFDETALDRIAALYTASDPVPANLVDRISFGITLDALHAELAELQRSPGLVGVRADEAVADTVTFTSASLTAMVTMSPTSVESTRVDGWIAPSGVRMVELRTPTGTLHTEADEDGRFAFEDVSRGLVQFTFRDVDGGHPVVTPALEI
jgi:hypothetical protein